MSSQAQKSNSSRSSASSTNSIPPETLIALPSLACSLSSLPQAKSVDGVALHPTSMSAQRAAESEAKLRKALQKSSHSSHSVPQAYVPNSQAYSSGSNDPPLMMRKPQKATKMQV
ncbi:hypothetical protein K474DRAFT_1708872 [Panus rudis PR-1116 ss-1]|nr:hypothetical protein K474DRAFT_1708872 [Panus rudis PR-1116 ss-1]